MTCAAAAPCTGRSTRSSRRCSRASCVPTRSAVSWPTAGTTRSRCRRRTPPSSPTARCRRYAGGGASASSTTTGHTRAPAGSPTGCACATRSACTAPWVEGVASSLTELFAPDLMTQRIKAFREHYPWIDSDGLAYFEKRCVQAPREASYALDVVVEHCVTPAQQASAANALTLKCDVLWSMLDAIDYAYREPRS